MSSVFPRESDNLEENKIDGKAALITLEADIDGDGKYGLRTLIISDESVQVIEKGGVVSFQMPISEIKTARNEPLVGGGRLEITSQKGEVIPVLSYTLSMAPKFSEAARGIEQLAKGERLSINLSTEKTRCIKCGRLLPEKDGVCPACVNRRKTLMRIASFLKPYKKQAFGLTLFGLLTTAVNLAPPYIQGELIDKVLAPHKHLGTLWILMIWWLIFLTIGVYVQVKSGQLIAYLAGCLATDIRSQVYRAIEFLKLTYFDKKQVGAISSRVTQDTDRIWGFLVDGLPYLVSNGLLLVGIVGFLLHVNAKLTLYVLSPLPVVGLISVISWKPVSKTFHKVGQKWARFHTHLNESITGIRVVKAFAKEDHEYEKFQVRNIELRDAGIAADRGWYTVLGLMTFFTGVGAVINWTVGGYMVYTRQMSLGDFWKVHAYLTLVYAPMTWFAQVNNWFSRAMAGAERIFEVIDTEPEPYQRAGLEKMIIGEVKFDNVRFGYDKSNPVLKGLTFTANPGEMIGLVGKSGAGKSTTINLISRFYEPDVGTIFIDGEDYSKLSLHDLRRQIGVVLQEPFLFNGSVADNIKYGNPKASFNEVMNAAKAANAHHFILNKPDGYDTIVGERGAKLSGGEKQRISIARAILHDPKILILDEATSSVDVETEKQIQEAIGRLVKGRTTFAIAHRLSTLRNADRIVVLDKGEIVEIGSHSELMEKGGVFAKLVETQSQVTQIIGGGADK